ncbi:MAG: hypothetical protein QM680_03850 [Luteolibacter sp.]
MKKTVLLALLSSGIGLTAVHAEADCSKLSLEIKLGIAADRTKVLEIVSKAVSASPACACEVVKAAVEAAEAKPETVAAIVEAAANAAPEQLRLVSQCAVAVAPDSLAQVQNLLTKLDPNAGEEGASAKSAKSAKGEVSPAQNEVAALPNPLDFPGQGPIGPLVSGPGGYTLYPFVPPVLIDIPEVTNTNPNNRTSN